MSRIKTITIDSTASTIDNELQAFKEYGKQEK